MSQDLFLYRAAPHTLPELMDEPASLETLRGCLRSLEDVTRLTGGYKPTLQFLRRALAHAKARNVSFTSAQPLRVLDLGSGGGDTLVRIGRWAAVHGVPVQLIGVDLNPQSATLARETELRRTSRQSRLRPAEPIHWLTSDALALALPEPPHLIVSSLFFHHLEDTAIASVLRWQHTTALLGWFISDLVRSARAARLFSLLGGICNWHPYVRHDGPVSFRRAFRPADWARYLHQASISSREVRLLRPSSGRLYLESLR